MSDLVVCRFCKWQFGSQDGLDAHIRFHHKVSPDVYVTLIDGERANDRLRAELAAGAEREQETRRAAEFFVRYWWEQHKPDERDLEMARLRVEQPDIQAVLRALAPTAGAEGEAR